MSDEVNTEETELDDQADQTIKNDGTPNGSDESDSSTSTDNDEFDAAEYEESFGLPAGSLSDVKDADEALATIREMTDKSLIAGLGSGDGFAGGADVPEEGEKGGKPDDKKAESKNPELDALRAEVAELKGNFKRQHDSQEQAARAELNRRIDAEIDSWNSPRYGTSKNRNYNQLKTVREIKGLLETHVVGLQATGQPISVVENLLRRVRAFDDTDFKPGKSAGGKKPLGTPGGSNNQSKAGKQPASIHEALMNNLS